MKKIKTLSIAIILCISLLAMASCGGGGESTAPAEEKQSKNGFDVSKNQEVEYGGYSFSVPDYCNFQEAENGLQCMPEDGQVMMMLSSFDNDISDDDFSASKDKLMKEWTEGMGYELGDNGTFTGTTDSGVNVRGKSALLHNADEKITVALVLIQGSDSDFDYISDFDAIASSARKLEKTSDENTSDSKSEDRAETDISPEFKATMDSYEEFFDEYVEFMQKYKENPSDTTLLMEMSGMMTKEAEMLKQLDEMDENEMTTAEAAYYLEVTARINEKLASVL